MSVIYLFPLPTRQQFPDSLAELVAVQAVDERVDCGREKSQSIYNKPHDVTDTRRTRSTNQEGDLERRPTQDERAHYSDCQLHRFVSSNELPAL